MHIVKVYWVFMCIYFVQCTSCALVKIFLIYLKCESEFILTADNYFVIYPYFVIKDDFHDVKKKIPAISSFILVFCYQVNIKCASHTHTSQYNSRSMQYANFCICKYFSYVHFLMLFCKNTIYY